MKPEVCAAIERLQAMKINLWENHQKDLELVIAELQRKSGLVKEIGDKAVMTSEDETAYRMGQAVGMFVDAFDRAEGNPRTVLE